MGSFTCNCGNTGVERTLDKSQHTKLNLEKKILSPLLPGFELANFRSRVRRFNKKLSRLSMPFKLNLNHSLHASNMTHSNWAIYTQSQNMYLQLYAFTHKAEHIFSSTLLAHKSRQSKLCFDFDSMGGGLLYRACEYQKF